jgi:superoxide dismutase, Cu-Zn family
VNTDRTSTEAERGSGLVRPNGRTVRLLAPAAVAALITAGVVAVNAVGVEAAGVDTMGVEAAGVDGSAGGQSRAATTPAAEPNELARNSGHRPRQARAVLRTADGSALGSVTFRRRGTGTELTAKLTLNPGLSATDAFHGFHVHANNNPENGSGCLADPSQPPATWFTSADGHLAEAGQKHGHHSGDLPSLLVNADGTAVTEFLTGRVDVADLLGRAVVLHAGADNFADVPTGSLPDQYTANSAAATDRTAATGNAGDRIACGVVELTR